MPAVAIRAKNRVESASAPFASLRSSGSRSSLRSAERRASQTESSMMIIVAVLCLLAPAASFATPGTKPASTTAFRPKSSVANSHRKLATPGASAGLARCFAMTESSSVRSLSHRRCMKLSGFVPATSFRRLVRAWFTVD